MTNGVVRVAVTGGGGQIAYNLLFRIAAGEMFGPNQPVALHILELPEVIKVLEGVKMELDDCAFPLLTEVRIGSDPMELFEGIDYALLVGAKPRGPGMERGDLLNENGKIFVVQGKAIDAVANPNVRVLVVGNPCNTNALIALHQARRVPRNHFYAMTRLDENRAKAQLAKKAQKSVADVTNIAVWGNHSATQVPAYQHGKITNQALTNAISDPKWLEEEFFSLVQKRGAKIIEARGKSSAASAAQAIIDTIKSITQPTKPGDWFSLGVYSSGNPYSIDPDLVFSFPCRLNSRGEVEIVPDLHWDPFLTEKIKASERELLEERKIILDAKSVGV